MTKLFLTPEHLIAVLPDNSARSLDCTLDDVFRAEDPLAFVSSACTRSPPTTLPGTLCAPIGSQEIWAAGVTYRRSRDARMAESGDRGGDTFYDRVYNAPRPELFFKATAHRTSGPRGPVRLRRDSHWNVPEPELTLAINSHGRIFGYTIGNDMSSRDIEGENPLYLPQAKVYHGCAALGPAILLAPDPLPTTTRIGLRIQRADQVLFAGETDLGHLKRSPDELAAFLFREDSFPSGVFLMTGTGIVPPDHISLHSGDRIDITIEPIGTLINPVA